jgi:RAB protein geranylgeranyltransferase component A
VPQHHAALHLTGSCEDAVWQPHCRAACNQVLVKTDVTKYLEFKAVDGSFVVASGKVEKVPANAMEALRSPLMGFFEKRRAAKFFR